MNKVKNFIAQIMTNRNLKWVLIFLLVWWLFVWKTYAEGNPKMTTLDSVSFFMHLIFSIASWGWIVLANLAGKLMTNDLLYWSFVHLDASLWTLRNIMKNFANFALWFLVLFSIVKNIFTITWDGEKKWTPLSIIKKTLIAWVLIQMSWFLMWAVVDLSTIMTSAVWSFPSQFIVSNDDFKQDIKTNLWKIRKWKVTFDPQNPQEIVTWTPNEQSISEMDPEWNDYKKLIDTVMPSYDSVSGPLLFLWLSVFDLNDFGKKYDWSWWSQTATKWWDLFMQLGISSLVLFFFSFMLFFIFIFNLFRLIMLWLVIPLMPIIILLKVFDILPDGDSFSFLKLKTILNLIFKPVIMVWSLSIVLIILVLIKGVINNDNSGKIQLGNTKTTLETTLNGDQYISSIKSDWILNYTMEAKDTIADLIVYFFGLFLMFFIVKMAVQTKTGVWFIDKSLETMFDIAADSISSLPIIPIGTGVSMKALKDWNKDLVWGLSRSMNIRDVDSQIANLPDFMQESWAVKDKKRTEFIDWLFENNWKDNWPQFYNGVEYSIDGWNKKNPNNTITEASLKSVYKKYAKINPKKSEKEEAKESKPEKK